MRRKKYEFWFSFPWFQSHSFFTVVIISIHLFPYGSWKPFPHPRNCTMSLIPSLHVFPSLNLLGLSLLESAICFLLQPWLIHKFHKKEENCKETMKKEKKHWVRNRIQEDTKINKPSKTWNFSVRSSLWVLVHVLCSGMGTRYLDLVTLPKVMWPVVRESQFVLRSETSAPYSSIANSSA